MSNQSIVIKEDKESHVISVSLVVGAGTGLGALKIYEIAKLHYANKYMSAVKCGLLRKLILDEIHNNLTDTHSLAAFDVKDLKEKLEKLDIKVARKLVSEFQDTYGQFISSAQSGGKLMGLSKTDFNVAEAELRDKIQKLNGINSEQITKLLDDAVIKEAKLVNDPKINSEFLDFLKSKNEAKAFTFPGEKYDDVISMKKAFSSEIQTRPLFQFYEKGEAGDVTFWKKDPLSSERYKYRLKGSVIGFTIQGSTIQGNHHLNMNVKDGVEDIKTYAEMIEDGRLLSKSQFYSIPENERRYKGIFTGFDFYEVDGNGNLHLCRAEKTIGKSERSSEARARFKRIVIHNEAYNKAKTDKRIYVINEYKSELFDDMQKGVLVSKEKFIPSPVIDERLNLFSKNQADEAVRMKSEIQRCYRIMQKGHGLEDTFETVSKEMKKIENDKLMTLARKSNSFFSKSLSYICKRGSTHLLVGAGFLWNLYDAKQIYAATKNAVTKIETPFKVQNLYKDNKTIYAFESGHEENQFLSMMMPLVAGSSWVQWAADQGTGVIDQIQGVTEQLAQSSHKDIFGQSIQTALDKIVWSLGAEYKKSFTEIQSEAVSKILKKFNVAYTGRKLYKLDFVSDVICKTHYVLEMKPEAVGWSFDLAVKKGALTSTRYVKADFFSDIKEAVNIYSSKRKLFMDNKAMFSAGLSLDPEFKTAEFGMVTPIDHASIQIAKLEEGMEEAYLDLINTVGIEFREIKTSTIRTIEYFGRYTGGTESKLMIESKGGQFPELTIQESSKGRGYGIVDMTKAPSGQSKYSLSDWRSQGIILNN